MRLRYMHLPELPPLEDIQIRFGYEPVLGRACALHFVVGVNGSGKSRLLRALAEIFLSMEQKREIPFPVTLVYDLGPGTGDDYEAATESMDDTTRARALARHTIYLHTRKGQTVLADFDYIPPNDPSNPDDPRDWDALAESDWDHFDVDGYRKRSHYLGNSFPSQYLPSVLLAYTSGATAEWEALFTPQRTEQQDNLIAAFNNLDTSQERPAGWDRFKESEMQREQGLVLAEEESEQGEDIDVHVEYESDAASMSVFVPPAALKFALLAVTLEEAARDFDKMTTDEDEQKFRRRIDLFISEERRMNGLRGILNEVDWLWPITIGLRIVFDPDRLTRSQVDLLIRLYNAATTVIREPASSKIRRLYYDVRSQPADTNSTDGTTAWALIRALAQLQDDESIPEDTSLAYPMFKQLLLLQQQGILEDITIALRKRTVEDIILYDWLSDGERAFLGRMAFFHLLHGTEDALVLLDEPETHFNDFWKREMVDIIDNSLHDDPVEVVLSTHSSIALTDTFDTEIVLLHKDPDDGTVSIEETPIKSFGASPTDIMRDIFGAPESVGQRAAEFLDLMLLVATYPNQVEAFWEFDRQRQPLQEYSENAAFRQLRQILKNRVPRALRHYENSDTQLNELLLNILRSVYRYTRRVTGRSQVNMADAVEALYQRLGPGYYEFEFRRRLQALRRDSNAASN